MCEPADPFRKSTTRSNGLKFSGARRDSALLNAARVTSYGSKRNAAPRARGKERLLPLGMFVKDDEVWR
jgi:hypothetical protein